MGRHSGFIALHAGLAARHADIVLLPEMTISHWDREMAAKCGGVHRDFIVINSVFIRFFFNGDFKIF
jgi:6-phosphofructokinase